MDDVATLHQLNLRDNSMVTLSSPSNDMQLSPALALDSITDRLWVSDQSNGSILSCDTSTETLSCQTEVNTSPLLNSIPRSKLTCFYKIASMVLLIIDCFFIPLVESITVDELRVYWTSQDNLSVYYVSRDDPFSLMTLSSNSHEHRLLGLSPGQQPWPAAGKLMLNFTSLVLSSTYALTHLCAEGCFPGVPRPYVDTSLACLTPEFGSTSDNCNRPAVQLVNKTNSSISVNWTIPRMLPHCQESVFSYSPLQYTLKVTESLDNLPGFPKVGLV